MSEALKKASDETLKAEHQPLAAETRRIQQAREVPVNLIGGGTRVIYDSPNQELFLSVHYAKPALLRASGGETEETDLLEHPRRIQGDTRPAEKALRGRYCQLLERLG